MIDNVEYSCYDYDSLIMSFNLEFYEVLFDEKNMPRMNVGFNKIISVYSLKKNKLYFIFNNELNINYFVVFDGDNYHVLKITIMMLANSKLNFRQEYYKAYKRIGSHVKTFLFFSL